MTMKVLKMNKIYVCYYDYGQWDNNSYPICFFFDEQQTILWVKQMGDCATFSRMELGRTYLAR